MTTFQELSASFDAMTPREQNAAIARDVMGLTPTDRLKGLDEKKHYYIGLPNEYTTDLNDAAEAERVATESGDVSLVDECDYTYILSQICDIDNDEPELSQCYKYELAIIASAAQREKAAWITVVMTKASAETE